MTLDLSVILFLPLAAGLIGAFVPQLGRWLVLGATVTVLGLVIAMIADFDSSKSGLQYVTGAGGSSERGVRYTLGVYGLNLFLIAMTAVSWVPCTLVSCFRVPERPLLY